MFLLLYFVEGEKKILYVNLLKNYELTATRKHLKAEVGRKEVMIRVLRHTEGIAYWKVLYSDSTLTTIICNG